MSTWIIRSSFLTLSLFAFLASAPLAGATSFNFSYEFGAEDIVLTGMFDGDLAADGDRILNIDNVMIAVNGNDMGPLFNHFGKWMSLSGLGNQEIEYNSNPMVGSSATRVLFDWSLAVGGIVVVRCEEPGTPDCGLVGNHVEDYSPDRWTASVKGIPEPAAAALFCVGSLIVSLRVRRPVAAG